MSGTLLGRIMDDSDLDACYEAGYKEGSQPQFENVYGDKCVGDDRGEHRSIEENSWQNQKGLQMYLQGRADYLGEQEITKIAKEVEEWESSLQMVADLAKSSTL